jgi:hypothetical protein
MGGQSSRLLSGSFCGADGLSTELGFKGRKDNELDGRSGVGEASDGLQE